MKIVINKRYGGFRLSEDAYKSLGIKWDDGYGLKFGDDRTNPKLVAVVEKLGDSASGKLSKLKVVEVPDDVKWEIISHDGHEIVVIVLA